MNKEYKISGSKTGKIEKNNIKKKLFKTIVVTIGVVSVSISIFNIARNRKKDEAIINSVSSVEDGRGYSEQIEKDLGLGLENKYEDDIDELCSYLYIIDNYNDVTDTLEKAEYKKILLDGYNNVINKSLGMLKGKVAEENGFSADDIIIRVGTYRQEAKVRNEDIEKDIPLHKDQLRLASSIAHFQGIEVEKLQGAVDNDLYNNYMKLMRDVIVDSVKLVDYVDDYKLPNFLEFFR